MRRGFLKQIVEVLYYVKERRDRPFVRLVCGHEVLSKRGAVRAICDKCPPDVADIRRRMAEQSRRSRQKNPSTKLSAKAWKSRNPEKRMAHNILNRQVRIGAIVQPAACTQCGASEKLDAHHEDYSKPLDVIWACRPCHKKLHLGAHNA